MQIIISLFFQSNRNNCSYHTLSTSAAFVEGTRGDWHSVAQCSRDETSKHMFDTTLDLGNRLVKLSITHVVEDMAPRVDTWVSIFMHSEYLEDQQESLRLFQLLSDQTFYQHAVEHCQVIQMFGRFPYRNKILGRYSIAE